MLCTVLPAGPNPPSLWTLGWNFSSLFIPCWTHSNSMGHYWFHHYAICPAHCTGFTYFHGVECTFLPQFGQVPCNNRHTTARRLGMECDINMGKGTSHCEPRIPYGNAQCAVTTKNTKWRSGHYTEPASVHLHLQGPS